MEEQILSETGSEPTRGPYERRPIRHLRVQVAQISSLSRIGLALIVTGVAIDLLAASSGAGQPLHHAGPGHVGHLVAMAGMTTTLAGVVMDGARRHVRPRLAHTQPKENSDAIR
jgi:hypothetical protein